MELQHTHNKLYDENEIAIIKEYAYNTKPYQLYLQVRQCLDIYIYIYIYIYVLYLQVRQCLDICIII